MTDKLDDAFRAARARPAMTVVQRGAAGKAVLPEDVLSQGTGPVSPSRGQPPSAPAPAGRVRALRDPLYRGRRYDRPETWDR